MHDKKVKAILFREMEQTTGRGVKGRLGGLWGNSSQHITYMSENVF